MPKVSNPFRRAFSLGIMTASLGCIVPAGAADLLDAARARGSLRIAMEGSYAPFNFKDGKTGQLAGYDVEVAKAVAARLGLKPEFVTVEWSAILAGLATGKYDLVVSQVCITPARARAFDFSQPYTYSTPQLIVRRNDSAHYASLADLKGKRVGVGQRSVFEQQARAVAGIEVRGYPSAPEKLQDLAFGRIDAALNDSLMVPYLLNNSALPIKAGARVGAPLRMGIAMRKGNPRLKGALDKALAGLQADGSLQGLSMRWFVLDASRPLP